MFGEHKILWLNKYSEKTKRSKRLFETLNWNIFIKKNFSNFLKVEQGISDWHEAAENQT